MKSVIFACIHSAGRSQMATAWFNLLADPAKARATAAGTEPAGAVHAIVVEAMKEVGVDLSQAKPSLLTQERLLAASGLITMGCGEACPTAPPGLWRDDWALPDPKGQPLERVREIRDDIRRRVLELVEKHQWGLESPPGRKG